MESREIIETLESIKILREVKRIENKKEGLSFEANILIEEQEVSLNIHMSKYFPYELPKIELRPFDALGFIPHVERTGNICYIQKDNLVLDTENPQNIIIEAVYKAAKTLSEGVKGKNDEDFYNEFESYIWQLKTLKKNKCSVNFNINQDIAEIKVGLSEREPLIAVDNSTSQSISRFTSKNMSLQNAIYVKLNKPIKPFSYKHIFTSENVRELLLNNIEDKTRIKLEKLLQSCSKNKQYIIIGVPQPNGNTATFGLELKLSNLIHPLLSGINCSIIPFATYRIDSDYMISRGGFNNNLKDKKGLLIGCGSVGGYIAEELVKSGLIELDIVDNDTFSIDNVYRHVAGYIGVGLNKAKAMKEILEKKYPHSKVIAYENDILELFKNRKSDFKFGKYDYIVIATGNPIISKKLNAYFHKNHKGVPVFFTWLDPYGIGGHTLVTNIEGKGCYDCLYENEEDNWGYNKAVFAAPNQQFLKSISGCGSHYMPYGSIDACQTAISTVRKILLTLRGQIRENAIYSFKNDATLFQKEGFKLSIRYEQSTEELDQNKHNFYNVKCNVCSIDL